MSSSEFNVTKLLNRASDGDEGAAAEVLKTVYSQLHLQASARMANHPPGQTLQPTALVHETYLKLTSRDRVAWENRAQFFTAAGLIMRDIIVDSVRRRSAQKRGGDHNRVEMQDVLMACDPIISTEQLPAVDSALRTLERVDARAANVVTLRFFLGMTDKEVASALEISERTVRRDWSYARAWLHQHLRDSVQTL